MYSKILVAYNATAESRLALRECIRLDPGQNAEIHLLMVITPAPYLLVGEFAAAAVMNMEEELAAERKKSEDEVLEGRRLLLDAGLNAFTHVEVGEPVDVIQSTVAKLGIDLVIVGHSRQKPLALRWWRGSVDAILVEKIRCSLLVAADPLHQS